MLGRMIKIRMATEVMIVLIESNDSSGRDLHFSKYDGQTGSDEQVYIMTIHAFYSSTIYSTYFYICS